jgi:hypothetical protein
MQKGFGPKDSLGDKMDRRWVLCLNFIEVPPCNAYVRADFEN